jgi:hypothetical protein
MLNKDVRAVQSAAEDDDEYNIEKNGIGVAADQYLCKYVDGACAIAVSE